MTRKGLVYVMDMESTLAEALIRRVIDMDQYVIFRKWDMKVDPRAEVEAYKDSLRALIISGSGRNVNSKKKAPPRIPPELFQTQVPILSICYGMQYLAQLQGARIVRCWDEQNPAKRTKAQAKKDRGEQGPTIITRTNNNSVLFRGLGEKFPVWMKHNWMLETLPEGWTHTASSEKCPLAAAEVGNIFAVQFHPEPYNSLFGRIVLHNFLTYACNVDTPYF
jgi:GMP synthase (glutamine-hydrolysing)